MAGTYPRLKQERKKRQNSRAQARNYEGVASSVSAQVPPEPDTDFSDIADSVFFLLPDAGFIVLPVFLISEKRRWNFLLHPLFQRKCLSNSSTLSMPPGGIPF